MDEGVGRPGETLGTRLWLPTIVRAPYALERRPRRSYAVQKCTDDFGVLLVLPDCVLLTELC